MRLDRFLSVAKIFKSRSLAALAIDSSMVFIDS
ncbi:MAG TPA: RNA-binding protein, partial [candidate division Zixibacteria bacterium]|nr:RNA-binding protein [candidate division Zixibacteria bacterium]